MPKPGDERLTAGYKLREFGAGRRPNVRDISELHAALLPASPIARLGPRFRERFYYKVLPELGLVFGTVAYVDGRAAGFLAATDDSNGFMGSALRQKGGLIACLAGTALMTDPRRVTAIWEAWRIKSDRDRARAAGPEGEILSLGVLPEFRDAAFRSRTGLRIGRDLVLSVMEAFRSRGATKVRIIIDEDNERSARLHEELGWRRLRTGVPGWRRPSCEYIWEPAGDPERPVQSI